MNECRWYMSGSATKNSILLSVLPRLNKIFNQSKQYIMSVLWQVLQTIYNVSTMASII